MDWFTEEAKALDDQLDRGAISQEFHTYHMHNLQRDAQDQQDREDIIAAGRGHLLA